MGSVSPEVFAGTQEPRARQGPGLLGCLGSFKLGRGLRLSGSFNTFTIVNINLCNGNMLRDENSRDASLVDPNSQREGTGEP